MKKKIMCCCFVLFSLYMWFCTPVQASTKWISVGDDDSAENTATFYAPLTSSGKKNKINLRYDTASARLKVYVDGKKALTLKDMSDTPRFDVRYFQLSKNKRFLQILSSGSADWVIFNNMYKYSASTHTLKKVGTLLVNDGLLLGDQLGRAIKADSDRIKVSWYLQPQEIGLIKITLMYRYKNGKFSVIPTAVKVKSINYGTQGNLFCAAKNLTFYKNTDLKKAAFRVSKGDMVKLVNIRMKGGKIYYKFKRGSKSGWQKSRGFLNQQCGWFEGIVYGN